MQWLTKFFSISFQVSFFFRSGKTGNNITLQKRFQIWKPLTCFLCLWCLWVAEWIDQHYRFSERSCMDLLAPPCSPSVLYTQQVSVVLLLAVCLALIILLFLQCALSTTNNIVSRANPSTAFCLLLIESIVNPLTASFQSQSVVDLLFSLRKENVKVLFCFKA